jgi:hypothetical protein
MRITKESIRGRFGGQFHPSRADIFTPPFDTEEGGTDSWPEQVVEKTHDLVLSM